MPIRRSMLMAGASLAAGHAFGVAGADWVAAAAPDQGLRAGAVADALQAGEALPGLRALLIGLALRDGRLSRLDDTVAQLIPKVLAARQLFDAMGIARFQWRRDREPHSERPATWRAGPVTDVGYGLLWFTGRLHGQRVAWAWGYGGQFALLAPELRA